MYAIPWYIALLISVPQTIFIIEMGFRLFNIQLKTRNVFILAVMVAGLCYLLRSLTLSYAMNTLILIAVLSLLSSFICNINLRYCFISVVLGVIIYGVLESILLPVMMKILGISMEEIIVNPVANLTIFMPIFIIALLLFSYIMIKRNFVLYDFGSQENEA